MQSLAIVNDLHIITDRDETTDRTPAVSAVTATSEIRLRSVVFDIFFLSLVKVRNFPTLARRSFDPLFPFHCGPHV